MQYIGFVVACGIGIVLMIVLAFLGLRWAGFIKSSRE